MIITLVGMTNLDWPEIAICLNPFYQNQTLFNQMVKMGMSMSFQNMDHFDEVAKTVFYQDVNEVIQGFLFGRSENEAVFKGTDRVNIMNPMHSITLKYT